MMRVDTGAQHRCAPGPGFRGEMCTMLHEEHESLLECGRVVIAVQIHGFEDALFQLFAISFLCRFECRNVWAFGNAFEMQGIFLQVNLDRSVAEARLQRSSHSSFGRKCIRFQLHARMPEMFPLESSLPRNRPKRPSSDEVRLADGQSLIQTAGFCRCHGTPKQQPYSPPAACKLHRQSSSWPAGSSASSVSLTWDTYL